MVSFLSMQFRDPLDEVFRSRSAVRALRALYGLPTGMSASARDVGRRAGLSHPTAASVLRALSDQGVVKAERSAGSTGFRLNRDHVLAPAIAVLFEREQGLESDLEEFLREEIRGRRLPMRGAFLFGSVVRGAATETSDIDLAVLCAPAHEREVSEGLEDVADVVSARFGNRLNVVLTTRTPEKLQRGPGSRLWRTVLRDGRPVIPLHDLRRDA